ncbi:MAG: hypothetical protein CEO19_331 [Parcubacteria group bacterium Gr01-1014_73]|nr:MAG: hypothetical protein CEO19_331 [Parcubacteria group bacterium Gr01-1014_73]
MATEKNYITDGPSKWDFVLSAADGDNAHRRIVNFELDVDHGRKLLVNNILIDGLEREDGSGENWLFVGQYFYRTVAAKKIKGFYSTKTRQGWFEFVGE